MGLWSENTSPRCLWPVCAARSRGGATRRQDTVYGSHLRPLDEGKPRQQAPKLPDNNPSRLLDLVVMGVDLLGEERATAWATGLQVVDGVSLIPAFRSSQPGNYEDVRI